MLSRRLFIGVIAVCFETSLSLPSINFAIQAQIPPVAEVDKSFSFTFSPNTFTSSLVLEYSTRDLPPWLQFESSKSTFSGVPSRDDVGNFGFDLKATDPEGTVSIRVTLIVIDENSVESNKVIFVNHLTKSQSCSSPSTLLLHPQTYFDLDLGPDIFEGGDHSLIHYATSNDNAPLPAWIHFDDQAVRFSGTTPSLLTSQSSPQIFDFAVLASRLQGFSQSRLEFHIAVTNHILAFTQPFQSFNVLPGRVFAIPSLLSQLKYDSQSILRNQLIDVSSNQPDWLVLDANDLSLHGTVPADFNDSFFSIEATDDARNTAVIEIRMRASDGEGLRKIDLGEVIAIGGQYFSYTFTRIVSTNAASSIDVEVDLGPDNSWLSFSLTNHSIQGLVPIGIAPIPLKIAATVKEDDQPIEIEYLTLLLDESSRTSSSGETGQPSSRSSSSGQSADGSNESSNASWKRFLPLIITIPVLIFFLLCLLGVLMIKRAKKHQAPCAANSVGRADSVESNYSGSIAIVADSCSESGSDQSLRLPSPVPQTGLAHPGRRPPTRRPLLAYKSTSIDSPETRSSWDDMLSEVHNTSSGQITRASLSGHHFDTDIVEYVSASNRADQNSALRTHKFVEQSEKALGSAPYSRSGVSQMVRQGQGADIDDTTSVSYQPTLRHVPLPPLSVSSMGIIRVNEKENSDTVHLHHDSGDPSPEADMHPFFDTTIEAGEMPTTNIRSGRTDTSTPRSARACQHNWQRIQSTSFSGSLWEDAEWTTQNSVSQSENLQSQGQVRMISSHSDELASEDRRTRYWIRGASITNIGGVTGSTSMRSQGSEPSQSNSLRFI